MRDGSRILIVVEQRGIDLVVEAVAPDGRSLPAVDSPNGRDGPEPLLLPAVPGEYEISVRAPGRGVAPGRYGMRVEALAEATPADRARLAAEALRSEAAQLYRQGTAESRRAAADRFEQSLASWRALGREREAAATLFAIGATYGSIGETRRALDSYREALSAWTALADPAGEAASLTGLGLAQWSLGESGAALKSFDRAIALEHSRGNLYGESAAVNNSCLVQHSLGDLAAALACYERALAMFREIGERGREASALNNLGGVYDSLGEPAEAFDRYGRAREIFVSLGDRRGEAQALNNIAVVHGEVGEPARALPLYERALAIFREQGDRLREASALHNLGASYLDLGEHERAREYFEQALDLRRAAGDRRAQAITLDALGFARERLGDQAAALEAYGEALALARAVGDRATEAVSLDLTGAALVSRGEAGETQRALQPARAAEELERALQVVRTVGERRREATILQHLGEARAAQGRYGEALARFAEALALRRAVRDPAGEAETLGARARVERRLGRTGEAQATAASAVGIVESLRARVAVPDLRASFLAARREAHELEIDLLMELDRREPGRGHARAAFEASERARARSLVELLAEAGAGVGQGVDPALLRRQRELALRLSGKARRQAELATVADVAAAPGEVQAAEREIQALLADLDGVEAAIRAASPRYAELTRPRALPAGEIQALLDPDTLLLEIALGEERSFLWLVDQGSVEGHELPPRRRIEEAARAAYARLRTARVGAAPDDAALADLGRMLLGRVAGKLAGKRLAIVADGALQYLPFGALPSPRSTAESGASTTSAAAGPSGTQGNTPLLAEHEIVSLPSASVLVAQRQELAGRPAAPLAVAVLADPVFDARDSRVAGHEERADQDSPGAPSKSAPDPRPSSRLQPSPPAGETRGSTAAPGRAGTTASRAAAMAVTPDTTGETLGADPAPPAFLRLPATRREAEAIAATAPPGEAMLALDFAASRATALSPALSRYRMVHLATHGVLDARAPRLSGLVLSLVTADGRPQEGFLGLADVYDLRLGADLVVLSGCETALGREVRGEGLLSLTRGFFYSGARRVVASLWRVQDRATAELMGRFYQGMLAGGRTPAAALREAQLAIRAERRWREPAYWAPFVLQGDWR